MSRHINLRLLLTTLTIILSALVLWQPLDKFGTDSIDSALKRSLISFALARGLNGVISVAQGTEFAIQPAGVGINFSPGEILDPVNDLIERFSWVMLLSSTSLGMQQVLMTISSWIWLSVVFVVIAGLLLLSFWWKNQTLKSSQSLISRIFVFFLVLRFSMPLMALANHAMYEIFLSDRQQQASGELMNAREQIGKINSENPIAPTANHSASQSKGFFEQANRLYQQAINQIDFEKKLDNYQKAAEKISENTIQLIVVYLMQTVLFPLLFLWLIITFFKRLFI